MHNLIIPFEEFFNPTSSAESNINVANNLINKGWQRSNYLSVVLTEPLPWKLSSSKQRSWNFALHSWNPVDALLRAYSSSGEKVYLEHSLFVALDWIANNSDIDSSNISPFAWYDMAVGLRAYRLAYLLQAAQQIGLLTSQQQDLLWKSLLQHANYLADDANIAFHNNHGYYQVAGQLAMGRRFASESKLMQEASEQGLVRLEKMLHQQFLSDGVHSEHSPAYHRMVYATFKELIDSGLVEDKTAVDLALRIEKALAWFVLPNQTLVNFGDTDTASIGTRVEQAKKNWLTPEMQFWASGGKLGSLPTHQVQAFTESGYWIVRQPSNDISYLKNYSYLALNAAFHSRTHKHADDLSFVWFEKGISLLVDAGRYGYVGKTKTHSELWQQGYWYSDPWRVYCESTRAHNTLEFDEQDFPRKDIEPYSSALLRHGKLEDNLYFAEAACTQLESINFKRTLFYKPEHWLVVLDTFADIDHKPHKVKQWFHLGPEISLIQTKNGYEALLPKKKGFLEVCSLLSGAKASRVYQGEEEPQHQGWVSLKERTVVENPAFCYEMDGVSQGVFATLFTFAENTQAVDTASFFDANAQEGQFVWQNDKGCHQLNFNQSSFTVNYKLDSKKQPSIQPMMKPIKLPSKNRYALVTIDTEALPKRAEKNHVQRLVWGEYKQGTAGIKEMTAIAQDVGAKLVYFVDACGIYLYGKPFEDAVRWLVAQEQDVQLHTHPEFLPDTFWKEHSFSNRPRYLNQYDDERALFTLDFFSRYLAEIKGSPVKAFRAGSFRWNAATLRAMKALDIPLSFNNTMRGFTDGVSPFAEEANHPFLWSNGLTEVQITERKFPTYNLDLKHSRLAFPSSEGHDPPWKVLWPHTFAKDMQVMVVLLHSWSLLYWDEQGYGSYKDDKRHEDFRKLMRKLAKDYDIITTEDFLSLQASGHIKPSHTVDIAKAEYIPKPRVKKNKPKSK